MQTRKQKVVHLTSVHVPSDTRILYRECATLAEAGYDVVLVATEGAATLPPGVRLRTVPKARGRIERMTRTVWNVYCAAVDERADIYHFHDPELMGIGLLLRARGARVVFDVHEDIPHDIVDKPWIAPPLRRVVAAGAAVFLRMMHRCFSAIVTATPKIAQRFPHRRTVVVQNFPRAEELVDPGAAEFLKRPRRVIYLGAITELRCMREMINAMAAPHMASDVRLHLAGNFESDHLERTAQSLAGWDRVLYSGYCPRSQVGAALSSARAGMLLFRAAANHEDALPNKLFEYLGAGLPVIISNTMRCCEIVREHGCGIVVDPMDQEAVSAAISLLMDNPALAQQMGERGSVLVRKHFQWKTEASKLTRLYAEIA